MAASWIKVRNNLHSDPRIMFLAGQTGRHPFYIEGCCVWLWSVADEHTIDGKLLGYSAKRIDAATGIRGFSKALTEIPKNPDGSGGAWLEIGDGFVQIVDFFKHNGATQKSRLTERVRKQNSRDECPVDSGTSVPANPDANRPSSCSSSSSPSVPGSPLASEGAEKKPKGKAKTAQRGVEPPGFAAWWVLYPPTHRKEKRPECLRLWQRLGLEPITTEVVDGLNRWIGSHDWAKNAGAFIPSPHPWLNARRWEQHPPAAGTVKENVNVRDSADQRRAAKAAKEFPDDAKLPLAG